MIDFRSSREARASAFDYMSVRIASPEEIRGPKDPKERERLADDLPSMLPGLNGDAKWQRIIKDDAPPPGTHDLGR